MTDRKFHRKGLLSLNSIIYIEEEKTVLSGDLSQILQPPPADNLVKSCMINTAIYCFSFRSFSGRTKKTS